MNSACNGNLAEKSALLYNSISIWNFTFTAFYEARRLDIYLGIRTQQRKKQTRSMGQQGEYSNS